jgi:FtsZ-binding cell division protein ZapB
VKYYKDRWNEAKEENAKLKQELDRVKAELEKADRRNAHLHFEHANTELKLFVKPKFEEIKAFQETKKS